MRVAFGKLHYTTLKGRIADEIQEAILSGTLREGERLVERKLADQFATSLTAVREALIELEAKGFVTKKPNFATYVTKFSSAAVEKVFTFRRIVEVFTVEEAARVASLQQIETLGEAYRELLQAAHAKDTELFLQKDLALHELIWHMAGNECFEIALRRIVRPFFAFTVIRFAGRVAFDLVQDAYNHLAFVAPIKSKDPETARTAYLKALDEWHSQTRAHMFSEQAAQS